MEKLTCAYCLFCGSFAEMLDFENLKFEIIFNAYNLSLYSQVFIIFEMHFQDLDST